MSDYHDELSQSLVEVKETRDRAEFLRDQLAGEYQRVCEEDACRTANDPAADQRRLGREAMRKAILAADRAVMSIDQALREMARVLDEGI